MGDDFAIRMKNNLKTGSSQSSPAPLLLCVSTGSLPPTVFTTCWVCGSVWQHQSPTLKPPSLICWRPTLQRSPRPTSHRGWSRSTSSSGNICWSFTSKKTKRNQLYIVVPAQLIQSKLGTSVREFFDLVLNLCSRRRLLSVRAALCSGAFILVADVCFSLTHTVWYQLVQLILLLVVIWDSTFGLAI